jgi:transcriptional regulator with XRE-family HTH domain
MPDLSQISNRIREIRISQNMSQTRFGKKIGVSGKTISSYETGRSLPPIKILETVAETYKVDIIPSRTKDKSLLISKIQGLKSTINEIEQTLKASLSL